jgi:hypothetical protein
MISHVAARAAINRNSGGALIISIGSAHLEVGPALHGTRRR